MRDNPLDYDPHEACRREMGRIGQKWRERNEIRRVILEKEDGSLHIMPITRIYQSDHGLEIFIK